MQVTLKAVLIKLDGNDSTKVDFSKTLAKSVVTMSITLLQLDEVTLKELNSPELLFILGCFSNITEALKKKYLQLRVYFNSLFLLTSQNPSRL